MSDWTSSSKSSSKSRGGYSTSSSSRGRGRGSYSESSSRGRGRGGYSGASSSGDRSRENSSGSSKVNLRTSHDERVETTGIFTRDQATNSRNEPKRKIKKFVPLKSLEASIEDVLIFQIIPQNDKENSEWVFGEVISIGDEGIEVFLPEGIEYNPFRIPDFEEGIEPISPSRSILRKKFKPYLKNGESIDDLLNILDEIYRLSNSSNHSEKEIIELYVRKHADHFQNLFPDEISPEEMKNALRTSLYHPRYVEMSRSFYPTPNHSHAAHEFLLAQTLPEIESFNRKFHGSNYHDRISTLCEHRRLIDKDFASLPYFSQANRASHQSFSTKVREFVNPNPEIEGETFDHECERLWSIYNDQTENWFEELRFGFRTLIMNLLALYFRNCRLNSSSEKNYHSCARIYYHLHLAEDEETKERAFGKFLTYPVNHQNVKTYHPEKFTTLGKYLKNSDDTQNVLNIYRYYVDSKDKSGDPIYRYFRIQSSHVYMNLGKISSEEGFLTANKIFEVLSKRIFSQIVYVRLSEPSLKTLTSYSYTNSDGEVISNLRRIDDIPEGFEYTTSSFQIGSLVRIQPKWKIQISSEKTLTFDSPYRTPSENGPDDVSSSTLDWWTVKKDGKPEFSYWDNNRVFYMDEETAVPVNFVSQLAGGETLGAVLYSHEGQNFCLFSFEVDSYSVLFIEDIRREMRLYDEEFELSLVRNSGSEIPYGSFFESYMEKYNSFVSSIRKYETEYILRNQRIIEENSNLRSHIELLKEQESGKGRADINDRVLRSKRTVDSKLLDGYLKYASLSKKASEVVSVLLGSGSIVEENE